MKSFLSDEVSAGTSEAEELMPACLQCFLKDILKVKGHFFNPWFTGIPCFVDFTCVHGFLQHLSLT